MALRRKYDDIPEGHAFAEKRAMHLRDVNLRKAGFTIHSRPKGGEPVWKKDGRLWSQSSAIESLGKNAIED